eukprot:1759699-Amphidinium_carterae.1
MCIRDRRCNARRSKCDCDRVQAILARYGSIGVRADLQRYFPLPTLSRRLCWLQQAPRVMLTWRGSFLRSTKVKNVDHKKVQ